MIYRVFIDGAEGTTGLKIRERFAAREDIELVPIDPEKRKDLAERARVINGCDAAILCLPDAASREIAPHVAPEVRLLDASTAHRTDPGWVYGLPELSSMQRLAVIGSRRVAVPGCHATGFAVLVYPLIALGIAPKDYPFVCHSLTGYSGGGKKMIAAYEDPQRPGSYNAPRQYALGQRHKHLPEMQKAAGLLYPPIFNPIVADYYSGMLVNVPLHSRLLRRHMTAESIHDAFAAHYEGQQFVRVRPFGDLPPDGTLSAGELSGRNDLEIFVYGRDEQIMLAARFDNLGKGASGAAVQCMNLMLGLPEATGLL